MSITKTREVFSLPNVHYAFLYLFFSLSCFYKCAFSIQKGLNLAKKFSPIAFYKTLLENRTKSYDNEVSLLSLHSTCFPIQTLDSLLPLQRRIFAVCYQHDHPAKNREVDTLSGFQTLLQLVYYISFSVPVDSSTKCEFTQCFC